MAESIFKLANEFDIKLKTAQEQPDQADQDAELLKIYSELKKVVEGYLMRNPIKMKVTQRIHTEPANGGNRAEVAAGFVITKIDFDQYIRDLNTEIQKFKKIYPDHNIWAYYDTNSAYKAKL